MAGRRDSGTGAIYKDGNGYRVALLVGYDSSTGKPQYRKKRVATHIEAVELVKSMTSAQTQRRIKATSKQTLEDFAERWLDEKVLVMLAPKTYEQYRQTLRNYILPVLGKKAIDRVEREDVRALVASLARRKVSSRRKDKKVVGEVKTLSRRTLELVRAVLHVLYEDAQRDGLCGHNPAHKIQLPKVQKRQPKFLTQAQAVKLSAAVEGEPIGTLVRFLLVTGTRIGEARAVRWQDIDFEGGVVKICGVLQRLDGKLVRRSATKTHQDRLIPLPKVMLDLLQAVQMQQMIDGTSDPDGLVFLNQAGRRMDEKWFSSLLKKACLRAGVPPVSPHKLRHTFATASLEKTNDIHAVQKALGHQQIALTANLYGHATANRIRHVTDASATLI